VLAELPTPEESPNWRSLCTLYAVNPTLTLNAVYQAAAGDFLPLLKPNIVRGSGSGEGLPAFMSSQPDRSRPIQDD